MAKGRTRTNRRKPNAPTLNVDAAGNVTSTISPPDGSPQFFGESFAAELSQPASTLASIDFPTRTLNKNPYLNATKNALYQQINKGVMPFNLEGNATYIDIQTIVELCQKAYFNVAVFRNTIDTMTEFSNSTVFFKGGNEKSRKFFENWFYQKIGGYNFADQWFREWFRSGNVFLYRFDGDVTVDVLNKIGNIYGASIADTGKLKLPVRYIVLNPAYLRSEYGFNFSYNNSIYYLVLTYYECQRLRAPINEEEKEFRNALPESVKKQIDGGSQALFRLDPEKTYGIFCKKQDYEPFAIPLFFPVLSDIDLKLTYKGVEKILARTVEYVILLIKIGTEDNPNPAALAAMQELMTNETLGRVLVADGTTEMDFVIPDIKKAIGPEIYEQVNKDIAEGLMNVFASDEKFSSTSIKVKVFMERLNEARRAFLESFLNPEIKRISQELGFKSFPKAQMAEIDLNDQSLADKLTAQLIQLGVLTPEEGIESIKTGYLPTPEESLESQKKLKSYRDAELYQPLMGGGKEEEGRPAGSKGIKQKTKKVSPVGTSKANEEFEEEDNDFTNAFSLEKLVEVTKATNELYKELEKEIKSHYQVKRLSVKQKTIINDLMSIIVANETPDKWIETCHDYVKAPKFLSAEASLDLDNIMVRYNVSTMLGGLLRHCKVNV